MADAVAAAKPGSDFVAQLEAANLHPLWDRFRTLTPVKPQAKDPPLLWRWKDIEPFTERAVSEVAIDDVERRALILVNPAFGGDTVTTSNLIAAFTVLDPGDRARPQAPARGSTLIRAGAHVFALRHLRNPFQSPRRRQRCPWRATFVAPRTPGQGTGRKTEWATQD